jgi:outer membrane protein OmpA-like peptidoglycan-associated protein
MKKQIVALVIGSLLASPGFAAPKERAAKEEGVGLGAGAAIGAAAGGPVGFILGAAFGGWLGDRFHHERKERAAADQRAIESQMHASTLERKLTGAEQQLASTQSELRTERVAHREDLEQALSIEVYFRTEDSVIGTDTEQRIARLAELVTPMEGAVIRLDGHTDARGTAEYNDALSAQRAASVRDALIRAGMPADRIVVTASGELDSVAPEQDVDGMALDRRVRVEVVNVDGASQVARTQ